MDHDALHSQIAGCLAYAAGDAGVYTWSGGTFKGVLERDEPADRPYDGRAPTRRVWRLMAARSAFAGELPRAQIAQGARRFRIVGEPEEDPVSGVVTFTLTTTTT